MYILALTLCQSHDLHLCLFIQFKLSLFAGTSYSSASRWKAATQPSVDMQQEITRGWEIRWHMLFWLPFLCNHTHTSRKTHKQKALCLIFALFIHCWLGIFIQYVNNFLYCHSFLLLSVCCPQLVHWFLLKFSSEDSLFQLSLHHKCNGRIWQKHLGCLSKCLNPDWNSLDLCVELSQRAVSACAI